MSHTTMYFRLSVVLNVLLICAVVALCGSGRDLAKRSPGLLKQPGNSPASNSNRIDPSPRTGNPGRQIDWRGQNPGALIEQLRALGAPRIVIASVLDAVTREAYGRQRIELLYPTGFKRWAPASTIKSPELFGQLEQLSRAHQDRLRQLMGPDYDLAQLELSPERKLMWGNLDPEKITALQKIADDYTTIRRNAHYGGATDPSGAKSESLLDQEFERDVRAALSKEDADDFLMFNSAFGRSWQEKLKISGADVDEATYRKLYAAAAAMRADFLAANESVTPGSPQGDYRLSEAKLLRDFIDPESMLRFATETNAAYKTYDSLLKASGVAVSDRAAFYFDFAAGFSALTAENPLKKANPAEAAAQSAEAAKRLFTMLSGRLQEPQRKQFEAGNLGKMLIAVQQQRIK